MEPKACPTGSEPDTEFCPHTKLIIRMTLTKYQAETMGPDEEHLFVVFDNLINIRNECNCSIFSECKVPDITVKQIGYLKIIDEHGDVTFSRLAEITSNSKPTITEMVDKFVSMDCVYREKSPDDKRILYIRLTEKGRRIAKAENTALFQLIERVVDSLDDDEVKILVGILGKVR
jgi:DNA-binding MarR family transcriptional regulator